MIVIYGHRPRIAGNCMIPPDGVVSGSRVRFAAEMSAAQAQAASFRGVKFVKRTADTPFEP